MDLLNMQCVKPKYKCFDGTVVYLAAFHTNKQHPPKGHHHMQYYVFDNQGIASIHTQMFSDVEKDYSNNLKEEIANSEVGFTMIDSLQKMNFFKRKHGRDYKQKGHITLKCLYLNTVT